MTGLSVLQTDNGGIRSLLQEEDDTMPSHKKTERRRSDAVTPDQLHYLRYLHYIGAFPRNPDEVCDALNCSASKERRLRKSLVARNLVTQRERARATRGEQKYRVTEISSTMRGDDLYEKFEKILVS